jgi:hypothetical protein
MARPSRMNWERTIFYKRNVWGKKKLPSQNEDLTDLCWVKGIKSIPPCLSQREWWNAWHMDSWCCSWHFTKRWESWRILSAPSWCCHPGRVDGTGLDFPAYVTMTRGTQRGNQRRPTLGEIADAAAKKAKKEAAKKKKAGNCECQCEVECCVGWHCGYWLYYYT